MRHRNTVNKLNRAKPERVSLIRNLVKSIIKNEKITTTEARFKEVRRHFDRMVNKARVEGNTTARNLFAELRDMELVTKLMEDIAKRNDKKSGFLKAYKLDNRKGDNAKMVRIELSK